MKTLVIQSHEASVPIGLGDAIVYSHIPEIAKSNGYNKVYISNLVKYRNPEVKELVWDLNPFIDGYTDKETKFPQCINQRIHKNGWKIEGQNIFDTVMLKYGFDNGKRFNCGKIYYKPKFIKEYQDKVLFDPYFVTYTGDRIRIDYLQKELNLLETWQLEIPKEKISVKKPIGIISCETDKFFHVSSLKDYVDKAYSCKKFFCMFSGMSLLMPAIGKQANVFHGIDKFKDMEIWFCKKENRYINVGQLPKVK